MLRFSVPLFVNVSKNKKFILNLNNYRNAHHRTLGNAKNNFSEIVEGLRLYNKHRGAMQTPARFHYGYFPASKRSYDRDNIRSIIDKFLGDALINCGMLADDNYKLLGNSLLYACPVDRQNPRFEVIVEENCSLNDSWPPALKV